MARTDYVTEMEAALNQRLAEAERQMATLSQQQQTLGGAASAPDAKSRKRSESADESSATSRRAEESHEHSALPPPRAAPAPSSAPRSAPGAAPYLPYAPLPPLAPPVGSAGAVAAGPGAVAVAPQRDALGELDLRITRLQQLREWLKDDTLRAMMDDVIGQRVRSAERRQVVISAIVSVAALLAGWLLSAISPAGVLLNFFHH